jgi:hypothetical protein
VAIGVQTRTGWAYRTFLPRPDTNSARSEAATMSDDVVTDPRVSTAEAAKHLGVSTRTVLRMIHDVELHANRVMTPRITVAHCVTLPSDSDRAERIATGFVPQSTHRPPRRYRPPEGRSSRTWRTNFHARCSIRTVRSDHRGHHPGQYHADGHAAHGRDRGVAAGQRATGR